MIWQNVALGVESLSWNVETLHQQFALSNLDTDLKSFHVLTGYFQLGQQTSRVVNDTVKSSMPVTYMADEGGPLSYRRLLLVKSVIICQPQTSYDPTFEPNDCHNIHRPREGCRHA